MEEAFYKFITSDVVAKLGVGGMVVCALLWICVWLFKRSMDDKDKTITELREENKHYRDIFKNQLDTGRNIPPSLPVQNSITT